MSSDARRWLNDNRHFLSFLPDESRDVTSRPRLSGLIGETSALHGGATFLLKAGDGEAGKYFRNNRPMESAKAIAHEATCGQIVDKKKLIFLTLDRIAPAADFS